ncbi:peptidoglycan-binding protein [Streptomyces sp. ISID311]|uniref:peptidoglycan-binding protein n=1 Tax=Streptomyces sp. ISID311 TaxID=2601673 RepID=UPI0011BD361E|nr:peptidoglycan-binding protein [Streptomyces sp. ISID311]TXC95762.1 helix-turn-helix domain-containing protein [Streptomyces sp. ISID311]
MSRWKGLPDSLDHRVVRLVVQLRRLKDHSGLSLASLAAGTSYSKSSWERYLNGKKLPPRDAVQELARVCGGDATRLLALHEVALQVWQAERAEPDVPAVPQPEPSVVPEPAAPEPAAGGVPAAAAAPAPAPGRRIPLGPLVLGALAVLVVAGVTLLTTRTWQDGAAAGRGGDSLPAGGTPTAAPAFTHRLGETFECRVRRRAGVLSAGRSRTDTALLGSGATGWDVVEAQCLLHHQGCDPGAVDGIVGGKTIRAVKRLQAREGLPTDGIIGPDTWKVLRR